MSELPRAKRDELLKLVETSLDQTRDMLTQQGSFLPGSIAVRTTGKYDLAVAAQGGVDGANLLITALRQKAAAGHLRAAAIYLDVRLRRQGISENADAIQVVAELATGESINLFQVYRMEDGEPVFYDVPQVEEVPSVIFA